VLLERRGEIKGSILDIGWMLLDAVAAVRLSVVEKVRSLTLLAK